jgi:hypothetical protein
MAIQDTILYQLLHKHSCDFDKQLCHWHTWKPIYSLNYHYEKYETLKYDVINRGGLLIIKIDNTKQKLAFSFDIYIEVLLCIQNRKKN